MRISYDLWRINKNITNVAYFKWLHFYCEGHTLMSNGGVSDCGSECRVNIRDKMSYTPKMSRKIR